MEEAQKLGLTKSIGISNFNAEQIERILKIATIKPVVNQVWFTINKLVAELKCFIRLNAIHI